MFLKILTWGKNPIVLRLKSFTFLKIFVFILTKLYINVYILSVIVKSLMFQLVMKDYMIVADSPKLEELFRKVLYFNMTTSPSVKNNTSFNIAF